MRHINATLHLRMCEKLESVPATSQIVNGKLVRTPEIEKALQYTKQRLETLYSEYRIKLDELQDISTQYEKAHKQARVYLRQQQLSAQADQKRK